MSIMLAPSPQKKNYFFLFACLIFFGNYLIVRYLLDFPSTEIQEWTLSILCFLFLI